MPAMWDIHEDPEAQVAAQAGRYGAVIRIARVARRWSLEQAGHELGYSPASLSKIERGLQHPAQQDLRRLADKLHIPIGMLGLSTVIVPSAQERLAYAHTTHGGYVPGDETRLLSVGWCTAPDYAADKLEVDRGSQVLQRQHLTYHVGSPVRASTTWVPGAVADLVPVLAKGEPGDLVSAGISGMIEAGTGRMATRNDEIISARSALPVDSKLLRIKVGLPVLYTQATWRDSLGVLQWIEMTTHRQTSYSSVAPQSS